MGIQAMNTSLKNNNRRKPRVPLFKKERLLYSVSSKSGMNDTVQMKTFEYAEFQKKLFKQKKKDRKKRVVLLLITLVITILIVLWIPYVLDYLMDNSYLDVHPGF